MKKTNFFCVAASVASLGFAMVPTMAQASDGTISFTGSLMAATCTIAVNGDVASATVKLPPVSTTMLSTAGTVAGATNFNIVLSACGADIKSAVAFFERGPNVSSATSNLVNSTAAGTAAFVEVQLLDPKGQVIKIGDHDQFSAGAYVALTNNAATLGYAAQYYATGQTTAGTVSTSVTYSMSYL